MSFAAIVFFIVLISFIVQGAGVKKAMGEEQGRRFRMRPTGEDQGEPQSPVPAVLPGAVRTSRSSVANRKEFAAMEDREHDWLAQQLREESRAKTRLMSDMRSLKGGHARANRRIHGE